MKGTTDSDIFILNLKVTSLKILIKRLLYHLSFPESSMPSLLQKVFSYWTFIDRIQINAYLTGAEIFTISYKIMKVVAIPHIR